MTSEKSPATRPAAALPPFHPHAAALLRRAAAVAEHFEPQVPPAAACTLAAVASEACPASSGGPEGRGSTGSARSRRMPRARPGGRGRLGDDGAEQRTEDKNEFRFILEPATRNVLRTEAGLCTGEKEQGAASTASHDCALAAASLQSSNFGCGGGKSWLHSDDGLSTDSSQSMNLSPETGGSCQSLITD